MRKALEREWARFLRSGRANSKVWAVLENISAGLHEVITGGLLNSIRADQLSALCGALGVKGALMSDPLIFNDPLSLGDLHGGLKGGLAHAPRLLTAAEHLATIAALTEFCVNCQREAFSNGVSARHMAIHRLRFEPDEFPPARADAIIRALSPIDGKPLESYAKEPGLRRMFLWLADHNPRDPFTAKDIMGYEFVVADVKTIRRWIGSLASRGWIDDLGKKKGGLKSFSVSKTFQPR